MSSTACCMSFVREVISTRSRRVRNIFATTGATTALTAFVDLRAEGPGQHRPWPAVDDRTAAKAAKVP